MAEKIPGWLERVLLPQMSELKGEVKATNGKLDGEFKAVHSEIQRLDQKVDGVGEKLSQRIDDLGRRLDVAERLAAVEAKVQELASRR